MQDLKIFKSVGDCENKMIVRMATSNTGEFLGIKTSDGVLFMRAVDRNEQPVYDKSIFLVCDIGDVPEDLLITLKIKRAVISVEPEKQILRG